MSGNAGGGKDPCFWCAAERGSRAVIDDESTTPRNIADLSIPLCRSAKREILGVVARRHEVGSARVGAAVKPVGKLDVRNGHVQFDERGRETIGGLCGPDQAPFLDSTGLSVQQMDPEVEATKRHKRKNSDGGPPEEALSAVDLLLFVVLDLIREAFKHITS
jgi:hypothetical protein